LCGKKWSVVAGAIFADYGRFLGVFWKKWVVGRGFFVVKMWWNAWQTWFPDGRYFTPKNGTQVCNIFSVLRIDGMREA
jgi:hypothetical protein